MPVSGLDLIVNRADLSKARVEPATFPDALPEGSCLLEIDSFALTANNITYGVAADMLGYWDFFPTGNAETGRIPVWGFARVMASAHPEIKTGTRVYGYLPMSTHVLVRPGNITPQGFMDVAAHRAARAPIYNHYAFTAADPMWQPGAEAMISLFRPLFTTSFLLEDLHRENEYFGAETVVLASASSKTAIGMAYLLARDRPEGLRIVGLTSASNQAFVEGLGCYDLVLSYDGLDGLPNGATAFVDMAGNADLRRQVHTRLGEKLKSSRAVGMTHWQASRGLGGETLPGARPEFFFAPAYAQERIADLGRSEFQKRLGAAWTDFIEAAQGWITVQEFHGPDAVLARYKASQRGEIAPEEGHILSLREG